MIRPSTLYIVATPIGNMQDITLRAIEVLKGVDIVAAEDTRHSGKLLNHLDIGQSFISFNDHASEGKTEHLCALLESGKSLALVSDAGTPLISDPGYSLVKAARARGIDVVPIPGASALIAALSAAGMPTDRFLFAGFAPAKQGARQMFYGDFADATYTLVFYESPHRILAALADLKEVFGSAREIVLARELTKTFETFLTGSIAEVEQCVQNDSNQQRGEFVVIVDGVKRQEAKNEVSAEASRWMSALMAELPLKKAAAIVAQMTGDKKNTLYKWGLEQ